MQNHFCLVISALFIMCIGAVMFAQCFTWLKRVVPALDGGNPYGFKALTYVRYVGPFLGPVFMTGIAMIYEKRESIRKYLVGFAYFFCHSRQYGLALFYLKWEDQEWLQKCTMHLAVMT